MYNYYSGNHYPLILRKPNNQTESGVLYNNVDWIDNDDGTITLPQNDVILYDNAFWSGTTSQYVVIGGTTGSEFTSLANNDTNHIYIDYNNGNPQYVVTTIEPNYHSGNICRYLIIYRVNNFLHILDWDHEASGLSNKLLNRLYYTKYLDIESGLILSLSGSTGVVKINSGNVWNGVNRTTTNEVNSLDDIFFSIYHSGGTWTYNTTGNTLNNLYYDNGVNLTLLTNNKYVVNWFYKGVEEHNHIYQLIGVSQYNNVSEAQLESIPVPPELITSHAVLVGRIIVQKGVNTGVVENVSTNSFTASIVRGHNDLTSLQGGISGEYYHLTQSEYDALNICDFIMSSSDLTTAITTGATKSYFRSPYAFTLTNVRASLLTAQTSGSTFTVDINMNGTSILSTKLTIDNTENTSTTAAIPAVISTTTIIDDALITVDVDQIGSGTAKGLIVSLIGNTT